MTITKKFVIKRQSGFSFLYFEGFERAESDLHWTGHIEKAETFDTQEDAEKMLSKENEYDYRVFNEDIYWIDEIIIKKNE